jgi:hypothetical protein
MASLSTSCVLKECKHVDVSNGDLHKKILANLGDYTQLVTPETQMITDNDGDNGCHSGQNVHGFASVYVDGHYTKAYA